MSARARRHEAHLRRLEQARIGGPAVVVVPREAAQAALRLLEEFEILRNGYAATEIRKALR